MLPRYLRRRALVLCIALGAPASLSAQGSDTTGIDSVVARLRSPDFNERWGAVVRLRMHPRAQLPPRAVTEIVALLDREADPNLVTAAAASSRRGPASLPPDTAGGSGTEVDHSYGEYILAVIDVALSLEDPRTVRGIALMGVETSRRAQDWVASHGSAALPALDEAWRVTRSGHTGILGTWALMIGRYPERLAAGDASAIRRRMLRALDERALSFVLVARSPALPETIPLLEALAAEWRGMTRSSALRALELLRPVRDAMPTDTLLGRLGAWVGVVCLDTTTAARRAACTSLGDAYGAVTRHVPAGRPARTLEALVDLSARADAGLAAGGITRHEHRLIAGNATYLAGRLRTSR